MVRRSRSTTSVPSESSLAKMLASIPGHVVTRPVDWVRGLEASLGHRMSNDLRTFIAWAGKRKGHTELAYTSFESAWPAATVSSVPWLSGFTGFTIAPLIEAFTETVCIGSDSSGNMYFADADPQRSEVVFYDHTLGTLHFLAGSVAEFVRLLELSACWETLESELARETHELTRKDFAQPPLSELRAALRKLDVSVPVGRAPSTDFDASVPPLAGKKLSQPKRASRAVTLFERGRWLSGLFFFDSARDLAAVQRRSFTKETKDRTLGSLRATKLYWLWHLALFGRDDELAIYRRSLERDRSELVRRTVKLLGPGGITKRAEFEKLSALRKRIREELADPSGTRRERKARQAQRATIDEQLAAAADREQFAQALAWFQEEPARCRREKQRFDALLNAMREHPDHVAAHAGDIFDLAEELERFHAGRLALLRCLIATPIPKQATQRDNWLRAANNAIIAAQEAKQLEAGREIWRRVARFAPENPYIFHSAACALAGLGDVKGTVAAVRLAVKHDYEHLGKLARDSDLTKVLGKRRLAALVD